MKRGLLFLALFCAQVAVCVDWNQCSRHLLRKEFGPFLNPSSGAYQGTLADLDLRAEYDKLNVAATYESKQRSYQGELPSAIDEELARLYGKDVTLSSLKRTEVQLRDGTTAIQWSDFSDRVIVERRVLPAHPRLQASVKDLIFVTSDGRWSTKGRRGLVVIYDDWDKPAVEMQLSSAMIAERVREGSRVPVLLVEGSTPFISAIYYLEHTRWSGRGQAPDRQEQRRRTVQRDQERAFKEMNRDPLIIQDAKGEETLVYGGVLMVNGDARPPIKADRVLTPSQARVVKKVTYRAPSLFEQPTHRSNRVLQSATLNEGGSVDFVQYDLSGGTVVEVACNSANYCVETWYEDGVAIRKVNGQGNRILREGIDRQRHETRPNQVYPFNPWYLPSLQVRGTTVATPVPQPAQQPSLGFLETGSVMVGYSVIIR